MHAVMPIHPGEVLESEFLEPKGLSAEHLAAATGIPTDSVIAIINGMQGVTSETAALLASSLGTSPEFWMNLQARYDLELLWSGGRS